MPGLDLSRAGWTGLNWGLFEEGCVVVIFGGGGGGGGRDRRGLWRHGYARIADRCREWSLSGRFAIRGSVVKGRARGRGRECCRV